MRKLFYFLICTLLFVACEDKEDTNENAELTISAESCKFTHDSVYQKIYIYSGNGNYSVHSMDESVAIARIYNDTVFISAVAMGSTNVTVKDGKGFEKEISVQVLDRPSYPMPLYELFFVKTGTVRKYAVSSLTSKYNHYYVEVSDNTIAEAKIVGDSIEVKGLKQGDAVVNIMNYIWAVPVRNLSVKCFDKFDIEFSQDNIGVREGEETETLIVIGNGGYAISSSDDDIATAEILPYVIPEGVSFKGINPAIIKVKGHKQGEVTLTVIDNDNQEANITVWVYFNPFIR